MRVRFIYRFMILSALAAFPATNASNAQEAFSRVSFSAGGTQNANRNDFHDQWASGNGGEIAFATLFYAGEAEIGVALHRYDAVDPEVPRFDAVWTHLGWSLNLSPFEILSWRNGFDVGNYWMTFDEETFAGVRSESELTLGLLTRLDLHLSRAVSLYAAGRYMQLYTSPRLRMAYISGGLRVTLKSPDWLMTFLR